MLVIIIPFRTPLPYADREVQGFTVLKYLHNTKVSHSCFDETQGTSDEVLVVGEARVAVRAGGERKGRDTRLR